MMTEVNKIYEQIGVSFYIDSISYTNKGEWLEVRRWDGNKYVKDLVKRRELVDVSKNTDGLELDFVDKTSDRAAADSDAYGIVLSSKATAKGLAHELGHAFGCSDIYHVKKSDRRTPIQDNELKQALVQLDWNNGTGCRYYPSNATQSNVICSLLMCGYQFSKALDLSAGSIHGYTQNDQEGLVDVGFFRSGTRRNVIKHK
jgi:hypothetical protein